MTNDVLESVLQECDSQESLTDLLENCASDVYGYDYLDEEE